MRGNFFFVVGILALLLMPAAVAQQGHPLVGVWSGEWGPTPTERHPVVVEMTWHDAERRLALRLAPGSRMLQPARRTFDVRVAGEKAIRTLVFTGQPARASL